MTPESHLAYVYILCLLLPLALPVELKKCRLLPRTINIASGFGMGWRVPWNSKTPIVGARIFVPFFGCFFIGGRATVELVSSERESGEK